MKIQSSMPTILEDPISRNASSQDAQIKNAEEIISIEPNVHDIQAARLERALKTTQSKPVTIRKPINLTQKKPIVKTWKNLCHKASMMCGVLFLPSFACLAFGLFGLLVPASLLVFGIILAVLGGRPTEKIEQARAIRAVEINEFDYRQS